MNRVLSLAGLRRLAPALMVVALVATSCAGDGQDLVTATEPDATAQPSGDANADLASDAPTELAEVDTEAPTPLPTLAPIATPERPDAVDAIPAMPEDRSAPFGAPKILPAATATPAAAKATTAPARPTSTPAPQVAAPTPIIVAIPTSVPTSIPTAVPTSIPIAVPTVIPAPTATPVPGGDPCLSSVFASNPALQAQWELLIADQNGSTLSTEAESQLANPLLGCISFGRVVASVVAQSMGLSLSANTIACIDGQLIGNEHVIVQLIDGGTDRYAEEILVDALIVCVTDAELDAMMAAGATP